MVRSVPVLVAQSLAEAMKRTLTCAACGKEQSVNCDPRLWEMFDTGRAALFCIACSAAVNTEQEAPFVAPAGAPHCHACLKWVDTLFLSRNEPAKTFCRKCILARYLAEVRQAAQLLGIPQRAANTHLVPAVPPPERAYSYVCPCGSALHVTKQKMKLFRQGWETIYCRVCATDLNSRDHEVKKIRLRPVATQTPQTPRSGWRETVRNRDLACRYCGLPHSVLTYDHVLPKSRGGKSSVENLVMACKACNSRKGNRTPEEAGMPLLPLGDDHD